MPYVQPHDFDPTMDDTPPVAPALRPQLGVLNRLASWAREASWWQVGAAFGVTALAAGVIFGPRRSPPDLSANPRRNRGRLVGGIVYGPGETGWVEDLGDETWRLDNVPFFSPVNLGDVVTIVNDAHGRPTVDRVLDRSFSKKSGITYPEPHEKNFRRLRRAFERKGWRLEGASPGMAVLAHVGSADPADVAADAGVDIEVERLPLRS